MAFFVRLLVNAAALWVATRIVPGVTFTGTWPALLGVALTFGVINTLVRPVATAPSVPSAF